jgi:hypothetical protein
MPKEIGIHSYEFGPGGKTKYNYGKYGTVRGDIYYIRGPEVLKGSGIRAVDLGLAAAAAGAVFYKIGKNKKKKIPVRSVPKQLEGKKTPKQLKGKHTGKYTKKIDKEKTTDKRNPLSKFKTYASGGGVRKARHK